MGAAAWNYGTVFALNTDGTDFRILHSFQRNSDGSFPIGRLLLSGDYPVRDGTNRRQF
jgi:hypothetical protein